MPQAGSLWHKKQHHYPNQPERSICFGSAPMRGDHSETGKTRLRRIFVINICVRLPTNSAVSLDKTLSRNMKWLMHIKMNWVFFPKNNQNFRSWSLSLQSLNEHTFHSSDRSPLLYASATTGYSSWTHSGLNSSSVIGVKGSIWIQWIYSTLPPNHVP